MTPNNIGKTYLGLCLGAIALAWVGCTAVNMAQFYYFGEGDDEY